MAEKHAGRTPNRLIHETSPYLLQHAYNPVDWRPWGDEALARARDLNRPILLSIGYSACHWCHVMERESFEHEEIASVMNEHFVCVKVDREERPDLDEIYMQATIAMNQGQGGWPMTVFLTPTQDPFFAGTYFPPTDRWGRPGFKSVLLKIADFWRKDADGLRSQALQLTERLKTSMRVTSPASVGQTELDAAVTQFAEDFDQRYGGFGHAPKFPPATGLSLLLRRHHRTGDAQTLHMVRKTLDGMAGGGLYDHIGGGFARYSTDERWLVPHFEKMLYDNALLTRTYLEAYQVTRDANYRRVATETLDYVLADMTAPEGGFYSATDADSEGVEGKFFVWTPEEVRRAVSTDEDARRFCAYFDITPGGNWEHASIPHRPRPMAEVARDLGLTAEDLQHTIARLRPIVHAARSRRVPPGLDDKVLTGWNGLMISAMADGARVLGDSRYLKAAQDAADFLLRTMTRPDGGLYRTYRAGKAHLAACLEDYAGLAEGLIDLYEAGAHEGFLTEAVRLAERILADFSDEEHGGFFTTARDHEPLILRSREGPDGATPSANAVAASALARLSYHFGRDDFRNAASRAIRAYGRQINRYPRAFAKSLITLDLLLQEATELALIGSPGDPGYEALRSAMNAHFLPGRIIAHRDPGEPMGAHPLLTGKGLVNDRAALYVCRHFACQTPVIEAGLVAAALSGTAAPASDGTTAGSRTLTGARLPGHATPQGTGAYAGRTIAARGDGSAIGHGFVPFGATGLTASRIGFGCYRVDQTEPDHREALIRALSGGCNLVDTSTNYGDGESERLVGSVLAELIRAGRLAREEVIVVSKIGYVQGENFKTAEARERAGRPYPDMVKYAEGLWHCLHPEFLADQLDLSLDRLGLATLDVCLLHNAEYFLSEAHHRGIGDLAALRDQFYARLRIAFAYLETQVAAGRLRCYGVSSNTATAQPSDPEATSLSRMLDAARAAAGGNHHFAAIQCPMNLLESSACLMKNTGPDNSLSLLDLARRDNLAVLVNRPLNAIPAKGGSLLRLAEAPVPSVAVSFDAQREIVAKLEDEYCATIAPSVTSEPKGIPPQDYFRWSEELARVHPRLQGLEHWDQIENQMIAPHLNQVLVALSHALTGDVGDRWHRWRERYVPELLTFLTVIRREAALTSRRNTEAIRQLVDPLLPEARRKESLSRKALWVLASTPGVTCVLNGMRTAAYVEDSLGILTWPPVEDVTSIFDASKNVPTQ